jgi:hypothetical protein
MVVAMGSVGFGDMPMVAMGQDSPLVSSRWLLLNFCVLLRGDQGACGFG